MSSLSGKVAWVTGAGSGIGLSGAQFLARAGANVVLSGRRAELVEAAAAAIRATGGKAEARPLDVVDDLAVAHAAAEIGAVDILVNSAGSNIPDRTWPVLTPAAYREVVDVNLHGIVNCVLAVLPTMRSRGGGLIINITSWAGRYDSAISGSAYTAAKHAAVALTHSLNREECVHGIRATTIEPGEVATPILDKRPEPPPAEVRARMLQADDLGRLILFVAESPPHMCLNEILVSPTWNRSYTGG